MALVAQNSDDLHHFTRLAIAFPSSVVRLIFRGIMNALAACAQWQPPRKNDNLNVIDALISGEYFLLLISGADCRARRGTLSCGCAFSQSHRLLLSGRAFLGLNRFFFSLDLPPSLPPLLPPSLSPSLLLSLSR